MHKIELNALFDALASIPACYAASLPDAWPEFGSTAARCKVEITRASSFEVSHFQCGLAPDLLKSLTEISTC